MKQKHETKALVLLSNGLDSRLACKILQEQAEVEAIFFVLPFAGACCADKFCVFRFCQKQGIKLHIFDCTKNKLFLEYMEMIKHPKYSRGRAMNPCIDCHMFMMRKAKELADKNKIQIIATGEVLGERPLSQTNKALTLIDSKLGFEILRPLSAKLLNETEVEKLGLVDRSKLFDISGRQRNIQMELANKYKIDYPTPGGGCLLTEIDYCKKLKPILNDSISYNDIKLLSVGRHFLSSKIILGKNHKENLILEQEHGIKIIPRESGPTALVRDNELVSEAKELIRKYSKNKIENFDIKE